MQATVQHGSWQKQWGLLVAEAWADPELKERLLADPAAVLMEHGIDFPENVELRVMEDTEQVRHLVLPPAPGDDLSDEELGGGAVAWCFSGACGGCYNCGCGSRRCGCDAKS